MKVVKKEIYLKVLIINLNNIQKLNKRLFKK